MKKTIILIAVLAVAVGATDLAFTSHAKNETKNDASTEAVIDNIMTRTSIRRYQETPVEEEKVEQLLRAAMAAPTAGDKRPWEFVVITDKEILNGIAENVRPIHHAANAPLAIVVCGNMDKTFPGDGLDYWVEDTSAATENLLLAAHALDLGAVWCGIYPMQSRVTLLKGLLRLPDNIVPLNVVTIGYPAENPEPKDKWNPALIHRNVW